MEKQEILNLLKEFLQQYHNGSFSRMACDYIHATGMTQEEVKELLEAMKTTNALSSTFTNEVNVVQDVNNNSENIELLY